MRIHNRHRTPSILALCCVLYFLLVADGFTTGVGSILSLVKSLGRTGPPPLSLSPNGPPQPPQQPFSSSYWDNHPNRSCFTIAITANTTTALRETTPSAPNNNNNNNNNNNEYKIPLTRALQSFLSLLLTIAATTYACQSSILPVSAAVLISSCISLCTATKPRSLNILSTRIGNQRLLHNLHNLQSNRLGLNRHQNLGVIRQKQSLHHLTQIFPTRKIFLRKTFLALSLYLTITSTIDYLQTLTRQRTDATSEWSRYAERPDLRGRALTLLSLRITPYLLLAKLSPSPTHTKQLKQRSGSILADGLLRLGPLYIKIGQILSCRDDLLPEEWKVSLERLQDRVPAREGKAARELVYSSYEGGKEGFDAVFEEFEEIPIAAASLGQVHRARLRVEGGEGKGAVVALKVQRPKLREIYDRDLALMQRIARAVDGVSEGVRKMGRKGGGNGEGGGASWVEIFSDAKEILYREIDYRDEATNARRFADDFGLGYGGKPSSLAAPSPSEGSEAEEDNPHLPSAASWLRTPYVYEDLSTETVLVMEYVPSMKITDFESLRKAGVTDDDRIELAENLARAYLRMFCVNRFFSTDPHPGNLGVEIVPDERGGKEEGDDGDGGRKSKRGKVRSRLVFYDLGQACSLQRDQAGGILDVIEGIVDLDVDACVDAFDRMGVLVDGADLAKIKVKVKNNFDSGMLKVKEKKKRKKRNNYKDAIVIDDTKTLDVVQSTTPAVLPLSPSLSTQATLVSSTTMTTYQPEAEQERVKDSEIMAYFTLPSEYAFVARALSQMDGVGKELDPDFDFISAMAPHIVEIKGGGKRYVEDKVKKKLAKLEDRLGGYRLGLGKVFGGEV